MKRISSMLARPGAVAVAMACAALGFASAASAATYNVTDTRDYPQSSTATPGTCVSTASTCTLRAAIQAANQNGRSNTINLAAGTYPISSSTASPGDLKTGAFKVNVSNNSTAITLVGAGSGNTVINAQSKDRIFEVWPNGSLDVQKTTLENGAGTGSDTADLPDGDGGAIDSAGHLSAESDVFTGNIVSAGNAIGGAIAAEGVSGSTLSASGDVFQNNTASDGGAVSTNAPNDVTISFSLFQANNAFDEGAALFGCSTSICGSGGAAGLTLNFDDIVQNIATNDGGGLGWLGNGAVNVTNSLFNQNSASGADGGAIYSNGSTSSNVNVSTTSFDANSANNGEGGALNDQESNGLNLTQDKFSGNTSDGGGALDLDASSATPTTITSSEFDGNNTASSGGDGGAIDWDLGPLTILGSSFVLNTAVNGGAVDAEGGGIPGTPQLLSIEDSTISRNNASGDGGALFMNDGSGGTCAGCVATSLINDTVAFNNAPSGQGGGVWDAGDFASGGSAGTGFGVENTTIAENSGGDCSSTGGTVPKTVDLGHNNDSDQTCFGGLGGPGDLVGANPLLSNPANNGGPAAGGPGDTETVQTDAEQSSSPTVDAGNNNGCPTVDERGVTRPQGKACDIGAYEFGANPATTTSTTTTGGVTISRTTVTVTTTKPVKGSTKPTSCPKGKHKSGGKCVKNKKPKKKKCPKGKVRRGNKCVKKGKKK